jgi:integrase
MAKKEVRVTPSRPRLRSENNEGKSATKSGLLGEPDSSRVTLLPSAPEPAKGQSLEYRLSHRPRCREQRPFESWPELDAVAAKLSPRYRPMVIFAAATGLRPAEWLALEWRDVDQQANRADRSL